MNLGVNNSTFYGNIDGGVNSGNINVSAVYGDLHVNSPSLSRKEIADWVSLLDFGPIQAQALDKRTPGTLEWVIVSPEFKNWRGRRGSLLWCPGPPGAGKTVFAAFVIDQLQKEYYKVPQSVSAICYIYCQYGRKLSVLQIFEVILKQLILSCPSIDIDGIKKMKDHGRRLPLDEIISLLQSIFSHLPNAFIVIDALDECFTEMDRHHLLQRLQSFPNVNILITSRDLPSIAGALTAVARLDIYAIAGDVRIHLDVQQQHSPYLIQLMAQAQLSSDDFDAKVIARARGIFLLADRHIDYLSEQTSASDLIRALDTLPTDATESHASAIGRINQQKQADKCLAYTVLSLVSYAYRSFKTLELRHAVAVVRLGRPALGKELAAEERIISACAGLLTVNKSSKEMTFIHYTVQEYLQKIRHKSGFLSEIEITKSFTRLICSPGMEVRTPNYLLVNYVASVWAQHVQRCEVDEGIIDMALSLLANSKHVEIICSVWNPYNRSLAQGYGVEAIHFLAASGLTKTAKRFLEQRPDRLAQSDSRRRAPLSWAAINGHADTAEMLLEAGNIISTQEDSARVPKLDVDARDGWDRTPLSYAASNGHSELVKLLLKTGKVNVDARDDEGRTPLLYAACNGSLEVVNTLLSISMVQVDTADKTGRTAFSYASEHGHSDVVKILLETGNVNVNAQDRSGQTPLLFAAQSGRTQVVKILLSTEQVIVDEANLYRRTPLLYAAKNGYSDVVRLLLETGKVGIDAGDCEHRTPFSYAAQFGHTEVAKLLQDTGKVNINSRDDEGCTPLFYAACNGRLDMVNMLLRMSKVQVNATDKFGETPLSIAARRSHLDIVKLLLETSMVEVHGPFLIAVVIDRLEVVKLLLESGKVSVDAENHRGRTALSYAAELGRLDMVKMLLGTGKVNVTAKDPQGRTPLSYAAHCGHSKVVKLLLEAGTMQVDIEDKIGRTPFSYAVQRGHSEVVKILLETGKVAVDAKDDFGRTPLSYAVGMGHSEVVKMLLETETVEIDAKDNAGRTPLSHAAEMGRSEVVKILLETGTVEIDAEDDVGRTPLSHAVEMGCSEVTEILLQTGKANAYAMDHMGRTPFSYARPSRKPQRPGNPRQRGSAAPR